MLSELPEVKDLPESSKDSELDTCKRNPTEVTEKSDVLELGILLEFSQLSPEQVNWVITTELNLTKKFIESEKVMPKITLLLLKI